MSTNVEKKQANLGHTFLQISGTMQILAEEIGKVQYRRRKYPREFNIAMPVSKLSDKPRIGKSWL